MSGIADHLDQDALSRWRANPIAFIEECLVDPETRRPFVLLPAERAFLAHAFETDEDGRLRYPELVFASIKKSGKTTFAALVTLVIVLLYGGAFPEATIIANDLEQARLRVFEMIRRIVSASPMLRGEARIMSDKIVFPALDGTITAISSDFGSAAGGAQNIAIFDELWAYTTERSRRLWDEMVPPPTRKIAARLTVTYAGFAGESALLEELYKRGMQQPLIDEDLRAGDGMLMFWSHKPIAPWQTEAWLAQMRQQLRPNAYLRMIENRFVSSETGFIDLSDWDACVDPEARPLIGSDRSLPACIGIDASTKHDATAVVVCAFDGKAHRVRLLWHRIWQPSPDEPLDFEKTIEATVLELRKRFNVRACLYDPWQMTGSAQRLSRAGVKMQEFPQSPGNMTEASQHLYELVRGRNLITYPDADIRLAISRAVAVETPRGMRIAKEKQAHKIDVVIALAMAALAAVQHQSSYDSSMQGIEGLRDFYAGVAGYGPVPPDRTGTRSIWSHPMLIGRRWF